MKKKRVRSTEEEESESESESEEEESEDDNEDDEEKKTEQEGEDWCFICKDGGKLLLCDHRECAKAYHSRCLKKRKLSLPTSKLPWNCSWHTCTKCHRRSTTFCYCCPTALCHDCLDAVAFLPVKGQYGFCHECRELAISLENEEVDVEDLSCTNRLFKEYYEIVKKQEGFILKDLGSPEDPSVIKQKCKCSSNSDSDYDSIEGVDKHEKRIKLKRLKWRTNRKLNARGKSRNEAVVCKASEVLFASIIPDNIKLVYLRSSLIQELLKEPESFEDKVKGSYVRVQSAPSSGPRSNSYQLMQVIGVKKASSDQATDIKLQLLDWPNDICINSLSDANFSEAECEVLRQKMKIGLLRKPTVDELQKKARSLHEDITDHTLAREKRALQSKIDFANEKGRRFVLYQLLEERKLLETPSYRLQLLSTPPKVIPDLQEPGNELKDLQEIKSNSGDTYEQNKTNRCPRFIAVDNECSANKTASDASEVKSTSEENDKQMKTKDASEIESISRNTDEQKKTKSSPRSVSIHKEGGCDETALEQSSLNYGKENPQNRTLAGSIVDVNLDDLLDQLIKPDVSCSYAVGGSSESVQHLEDDLLLLLEKIPISDVKSMIEMANSVFKHFNEFPISYTCFYERVRNYIRCSSLLASTEQFKQCSSLEELAAQYNSGKQYNAMVQEEMKNLSTYISEALKTVQDRVSDVENSLVKFAAENLVSEKENEFGTLRGVSERLKSAEDAMRNDLESPRTSKKQCCFEEVWEAFVNAKSALHL